MWVNTPTTSGAGKKGDTTIPMEGSWDTAATSFANEKRQFVDDRKAELGFRLKYMQNEFLFRFIEANKQKHCLCCTPS